MALKLLLLGLGSWQERLDCNTHLASIQKQKQFTTLFGVSHPKRIRSCLQ
jgi:hypothetical protein